MTRAWAVLGAPSIAYAFASFLLYGATTAAGVKFVDGATWAHWDSGFYEAIATQGYSLARCGPVPQSWCGDSGWFMGYATALAPIYGLGLPKPMAGVIVSWLFDYADLVLLWRFFLVDIKSPLRFVALVFAACCPGGVYMRAEFPMSMTVFFMLVGLLMLSRRRWVWAALATGMAGLCYPTALAMTPVLTLWVFFAEGGRSHLQRTLVAAGSGLLALWGLAAMAAVQFVQTGWWNAYLLNQSGYHHGLHVPSGDWWQVVRPAFTVMRSSQWAEAWEALIVSVLCGVMVADLGIRLIRRTAMAQDTLMVGLVLLLWLFPLTQANESYYRGDTLLVVPLSLLLVRLSRPLAVLLTGAVVGVFPLLAAYFVTGAIV